MKKIMLWMCFMAALPVMAQETYQDANTATEDLNGTARYVGMGGAMEALGADISTISTNPAGIGLFVVPTSVPPSEWSVRGMWIRQPLATRPTCRSTR